MGRLGPGFGWVLWGLLVLPFPPPGYLGGWAVDQKHLILQREAQRHLSPFPESHRTCEFLGVFLALSYVLTLELRASLATAHPYLGLMSLLGPPAWLREAEQQPLCGYRSERPPACTPVALPDSGDRPAALLVVGTEPIFYPWQCWGRRAPV